MSHSFFYKQCKQNIPAGQLPWIIAALLQDDVVWKSLEDEDFVTRMMSLPEDHLYKWRPGRMALLALGAAIRPEDLSTLPLKPLDKELRKKAYQAYEAISMTTSSESPADQASPPLAGLRDLPTAGLLALTLRERLRLTGSWDNFSQELTRRTEIHYSFWMTPLACLYAYIPDPFEMFKAFVHPGSSPEEIRLALHALLSQPLPESDRQSIFQSLANDLLSEEENLPILGSVLHELSLACPYQAAKLARWIGSKVAPGQFSPSNLLFSPSRTSLAEILLHADQAKEALELIEEEKRKNAQLAANLAALLEFSRKSVSLKPSSQKEEASYSEDFSHTANRPDEEAGLLAPYTSIRLFSMAQAAFQAGDMDSAQTFGRRALLAEAVEEEAEREELLPQLRHLIREERQTVRRQLALFLAEIGCYHESTEAALHSLKRQPDDVEILVLIGKNAQKTRQFQQAVQALQTAMMLSPNRLDIRQSLAEALENNREWEAAVQEREMIAYQIQDQQPEVQRTAWLNLASCAIHAKQADKARLACQEMLALNPEDGEAYALLGQAEELEDDLIGGLQAYQQAVNYAPYLPEGWLGLAQTLKKSGQPEQALEILKQAVQAVPLDYEIYFQLGMAWKGQGALTQACYCLEKAYELMQTAPSAGFGRTTPAEIAYELSQIKQQLGCISEAQAILESAYTNDPEAKAHPKLPYAYSRMLIEAGELRQALPVLREILAINSQDTDPRLDYARILVSLGENLQEAITVLHQVLETDPELSEARALLAEAYYKDGNYLRALEAYRAALETELASDPVWLGRLSAGMGLSALAYGQIESAIASLQEAVQAQPQEALYQRFLSDAYWKAELYHNSLQAARSALSLDVNTPETLLWFADRAIQYHHLIQYPKASGVEVLQTGEQTRPLYTLKPKQLLSEALNALEQASLLEPQRTDLLLRKAELQAMAEDPQSARNTLKQVLSCEGLPYQSYVQAASLFAKLQDPRHVASALEQAITTAKVGQIAIPVEIRHDLARAYLQSGDPARAVETWKNAIAENPQEPHYYISLAAILDENHQTEGALTHLTEALTVIEDASARQRIHYHIAHLYRKSGRPALAFCHAVQSIPWDEAEPLETRINDWKQLIRLHLAADLALALMGTKLARRFLEGNLTAFSDDDTEALRNPEAQEAIFAFYTLKAELALEAGEEIEAANALTWVAQTHAHHPRVMALQARFQYRQRDEEFALNTFTEAVRKLDEGDACPIDYLAIAEAACDLFQWETAIRFGQKACQTYLAEPFWQFNSARLLTLRAEYQHLCQALEVIRHAPGQEAVEQKSEELYQNALMQAEQKLAVEEARAESQNGLLNPLFQQAKELMQSWKLRGQAAFEKPRPAGNSPKPTRRNTPISWPDIEDQPDLLAAFLGYQTRMGQHISPEEMESIAIRAVKRFPYRPNVLLNSALALFRVNSPNAFDTALKVSGMVSSISKVHHTLCLALLAKMAEKMNDQPLTLQYIHTALNLWPDEPRWHALASRAYTLENPRRPADPYPAEALKHLESAVQLEPDYAPHYLALGKALLEQNAEEDTQQSAIQAFEKACALDPENPAVWLGLAEAHFNKKEEEGAVQALHFAERAMKLAKNQADGAFLQACQIAAKAALILERPQKALQHAEQVLTAHPQEAEFICLKAQALDALGQPNEALSLLKEVPEKIQNEPLIRLKLGDLLLQAQGAPAALKILSPLAEEHPQEPRILAYLAKALGEAGQIEEAVQAARMALQAASSSSAEYPLDRKEKASVHHLIGRISGQTGQLDKAVFHLNEAIRLYPQNVEPYLELGQIYQKQRQYLKAQKIYQQATQIAPDDPRPFIQAGLALKDGKDYASAEMMLKRAVQLSPGDVQIRKHLAAVAALNLVHNPRNRVLLER